MHDLVLILNSSDFGLGILLLDGRELRQSKHSIMITCSGYLATDKN